KIPVRAGEWIFGSALPCDVVGLRGQLLAPFSVGFHDFRHARGAQSLSVVRELDDGHVVEMRPPERNVLEPGESADRGDQKASARDQRVADDAGVTGRWLGRLVCFISLHCTSLLTCTTTRRS